MEMGLRRTAAVPAGSGFRGVFCAVLAAGILAAGCDDPGRITRDVPPEDLIAPTIQFVSPAGDTTYKAVVVVPVYLRIADPSGIDTVTAWVSGGLNFQFAPLHLPGDTVLYVAFPITPLDERTSDSIRFTVNASDRVRNRTGDRVLNLIVH